MLLIAGRYINAQRVESVLLPRDGEATVWLIGRPEPLHAKPDEVGDIQRFVMAAHEDGSHA